LCLNKGGLQMVLTVVQEKNILNSIKSGNSADKALLVSENIRLVYKYAQRYDRKYFNDIVQEGCIGLMHAADKYEFDRGTRFSTYASFWISQAIDRGFQKHKRAVRIPSNILENLSRIRRSASAYLAEYHRAPSSADLAEMTGLAFKKVEYYQQLDQETVSLDGLINDDDDTFINYLEDADALSFHEDIEKEALKTDLKGAMSYLNDREKKVINMHFGMNGDAPKTLAEISRLFELSRERVRQIKEKALKKIRESIHGPALKLQLN
jgi:RNA polymerase primary sigma factor